MSRSQGPVPAPSRTELWNADPTLSRDQKGFYVAISGNTGAGKSSLIRAIDSIAKEAGEGFVCVGERSLHHPYLRLMFSEPEKFAFPIQLNFMLQRYMVLLRHLDLGNTVIIERSHLDDDMFVREHVSQRRISANEYKAYKSLAGVLHRRIQCPDILILLDVPPQLSIERLAFSESSGERPREFPREQEKIEWVKRWHRLYANLHADFIRMKKKGEHLRQTTIIQSSAATSTEELAKRVFELILERRKDLRDA